tara:strand:- start:397 stop:561 length:165 start_codon:yes stop_codon:yes gene_type:complete
MEIYLEVEKKGIKNKFEEQCKKMQSQEKHKHKTVAEKWEYALYRVRGGVSKENY